MASPGQALDYFRDEVLGIVERPNGSNHAPPVTDGYWDDAWCCMGFSYVLNGVGMEIHTALCDNVMNKAKRNEGGWRWVESDPQPGDGVIFEWGGGGYSDHIGMLESVRGDGKLVVLECNTRYNDARRMVRNWDGTVLGFARPPWDHETAPGAPVSAPSGQDVPTFPGTTRRGSRGDAVRQVQQRLADRGWRIGVDGDFGPQTFRVVTGFQSDKGLEVDGIVGPITWGSLWTSPIT